MHHCRSLHRFSCRRCGWQTQLGSDKQTRRGDETAQDDRLIYAPNECGCGTAAPERTVRCMARRMHRHCTCVGDEPVLLRSSHSCRAARTRAPNACQLRAEPAGGLRGRSDIAANGIGRYSSRGVEGASAAPGAAAAVSAPTCAVKLSFLQSCHYTRPQRVWAAYSGSRRP